MPTKFLVIQTAALGYDFMRQTGHTHWRGLEVRPLECPFPAVTCVAQATFRTAAPPATHGMVANGRYHRELDRPLFWEQSARLVEGDRIWRRFRESGKRVGMLFWQQSLGEEADLTLSPAPVHKHHGGMIQDCYSQPADLYLELTRIMRERFRLHRYWGPMSSARVGDWIARAGAVVMQHRNWAPDLLLLYLPSLDYDLQRYGPEHPRSAPALERTLDQLNLLAEAAAQNDYALLVYGDYAIGPCSKGAVLPNRILRDAGFMRVRTVQGMEYPDFYTSRAFAVVDHESAHVYCKSSEDAQAAAELLRDTPGIGRVLDGAMIAAHGLAHRNSGELVLEAAPGYWLAYPWWHTRNRRPDYATHIDIHRKPGYDPCELWFGFPPPSISLDTNRIRGSHGRTGPNRLAAWVSNIDLPKDTSNLIDLASHVRGVLDSAK